MTSKPKAPALILVDKKKTFARVVEPYLNEEMRELFDPNNFDYRDRYIREFTADSSPFSRAFLDGMFPDWDVPAELYHYTKMSVLKAIAASGTLRLYALRKRIGEGELEHFAKDHGLKGYYQSAVGEPYYRELSDDLFYASLTPDFTNESALWNDFAGQGTGVRLKLRLEPQYAELRAIRYASSSRTALIRLNESLETEGMPPFVPATISKIGGFICNHRFNWRMRCGYS
jgi:hypothetical protein